MRNFKRILIIILCLLGIWFTWFLARYLQDQSILVLAVLLAVGIYVNVKSIRRSLRHHRRKKWNR